jgi:hypothetical protein
VARKWVVIELQILRFYSVVRRLIDMARQTYFSKSSLVMFDNDVWSIVSMNDTAPICRFVKFRYDLEVVSLTRLER